MKKQNIFGHKFETAVVAGAAFFASLLGLKGCSNGDEKSLESRVENKVELEQKTVEQYNISKYGDWRYDCYSDIDYISDKVYEMLISQSLKKAGLVKPIPFEKYSGEYFIIIEQNGWKDYVYYPYGCDSVDLKYRYTLAVAFDYDKTGWNDAITMYNCSDKKGNVGDVNRDGDVMIRIDSIEYIEPAFKKAVQTRDSLKKVVDTYDSVMSVAEPKASDIKWRLNCKMLREYNKLLKQDSLVGAFAYSKRVNKYANYIRNNCRKYER